MSNPTHNLDQLRARPLMGFGQHVSALPRDTKADRIAQLKQTIFDAGRELEQLLAEEG
jgi:hypothetical protein